MSTDKTPPPPHLAGNFAPVPDEITVTELAVTGAIPPELTGWYLRNGPNPHEAASAHWFTGDGMVHGVRLDAGKATSYRNRWVRTPTLATGEQVYGRDGGMNLAAGVANTHVVRHAGRTLALVETSFPQELSCEPGRELDTVGPYDFDGRLRTPMTAHPKTCPVTGELHFYGYGGLAAPYLTYHRADADGELTVSRPIDVPAHTMMHDFYLTRNHVVFMDLPAVFSIERAMDPNGGMPYVWSDTYGARLGVLRRDDPHGDIRWFDIDPCYVFHTLNSFEENDGQRLVLLGMRYPSLRDGATVATAAHLWRWTIDLTTGALSEEQLDDHPGEFPRIDDRLAGLPADFGHATAAPVPELPQYDPDESRAAIHRYDLRKSSVASHYFAPGRFPGEAAFAPADDQAGGPGWLMTYVYDASTDRSDLVVLDADNLTREPVATIHLPRRVPAGFHGSWLADA
ncbi:carotenoid oxygenase family protein [Streptomyces sp. NPDC088196]|uniref:carotenoid oxygenase family protein n=1 Tax=Streptomyces sp. NPDC088196 TaxID=3154868 RepID=UPI00344F885D